jgi:hypothetical protein
MMCDLLARCTLPDDSPSSPGGAAEGVGPPALLRASPPIIIGSQWVAAPRHGDPIATREAADEPAAAAPAGADAPDSQSPVINPAPPPRASPQLGEHTAEEWRAEAGAKDVFPDHDNRRRNG